MNGLRHPFSKALYEQDGAGNISVTTVDGRRGLFRIDGSWIAGDVKQADPHLCGWIGGPMVGNHRLTPSPPPTAVAS